MQGTVTDFLRFESSKFGDLPSIIMKLEKQGYVAEIYNLFLKLYDEEASFTLQELKRFAEQNPQNENFDIQDQFVINTAIFKSNFQLILQMIVEHIWGGGGAALTRPPTGPIGKENIEDPTQSQPTKKAAAPKKAAQKKVEKKVEANSQSQGDEKSNLMATPESKALSSRPESTISKSNAGTSSRGSSPPESKVRTGPTVVKGAGKKTSGQKKAMNLNPNPSSPLYTILYGDKGNVSKSTGNLHRAEISPINQADRSSNSNLFDRSSVNLSQLKNANQSGLSLVKSNMSGYSTARNKSTLSVQSEFNQVKGPATFSTSQRKTLEVHENSPGPAAYNSEKSSPSHRKRSPSPTFGKAPKGSWVDIVASQNPSPGPGQLYPSHQFVSK